jgi:hypothetical protein
MAEYNKISNTWRYLYFELIYDFHILYNKSDYN